jgi:hypothetical protein
MVLRREIVYLSILVFIVCGGWSYGAAFVDCFDANSPYDVNNIFNGYELGLMLSTTNRDPCDPGSAGIPGIQNWAAIDPNGGLIVDANNTEEMTCLLNKSYVRAPFSDVKISVDPKIVDTYYLGLPSAGQYEVGVLVCDKPIDKIRVGWTAFKGYYWHINGYASNWSLDKFNDLTAWGWGAQVGSPWNPPGHPSEAWTTYPINFGIRAVPDPGGPGTDWQFWYEGNGLEPEDPNYIGPALWATDSSNTFDTNDLPYFGVVWYSHDGTYNTTVGKDCFINAKILKLEVTDVTPIVTDPNAFDDDFLSDPNSDYVSGLLHRGGLENPRTTVFNWDGNDINCVSVDANEMATYMNEKYVRKAGSRVELITAAPLEDYVADWKNAGIFIADKPLEDDVFTGYADFSGYYFHQYGGGSYFSVLRVIDGDPNYSATFNAPIPPGYSGWPWDQSHFMMAIEPNGTSFDFIVENGHDEMADFGVLFPNGRVIYTDDSGLLDDADLRYFGVAAGSANGQAWNSLGFDRLKVSDVKDRPLCGDPDHDYPDGDLNFDCYVDLVDFAQFAAQWLSPGFEIGDLGIFVDSWLDCSHPEAPCSYNP